eukprot:TRINITY_DN907_c0_g1_i1.p1 TRINITY_DN907_c0_g1~~TRINITY_DN907_c0_g1_i1.p1  ORF type:complete len:183 (+),score=40.01 TRINITY_DN907_c0_g1_i1:40-588(+)
MNSLKTYWTTFIELDKREVIQRFIHVILIGLSAWMSYNVFKVVSNVESPGVVVLSGSMEPSFSRGDILFLWDKETIKVGDIVVYELPGQKIPIVHRVISLIDYQNETRILTKGDANQYADEYIYMNDPIYNKPYITESMIMGKVIFYIPWAGIFTILITDFPKLKIIFLAALAFYSFINNER